MGGSHYSSLALVLCVLLPAMVVSSFVLKGETLTLVDTGSVKTINWKQGSFLGFGGDRSQAYHECTYKTGNGAQLPVYIQVGFRTPPQSVTVDSSFQFGMQNGVIFLVLHDKEQTPYQHRFMKNPKQVWLSYANDLLKSYKGVDLSWIAGDYLRDIE